MKSPTRVEHGKVFIDVLSDEMVNDRPHWLTERREDIAARARMHTRSKVSTLAETDWDEAKHPRVPAGSGDPSGEFAPKSGVAATEWLPEEQAAERMMAKKLVAEFQSKHPGTVVFISDLVPINSFAVKQLLAETDECMKEFPQVAERLNTISFEPPTSQQATWWGIHSYSGTNHQFSSITFNSNWFGDPNLLKIKSSIRDATGVIYPGMAHEFHDGMIDIRSIARHEFGHAVDAWANGAGEYSFMNAVRASGFGLVKDTHRNWMDVRFVEVVNSKFDAVSDYATTNRAEYFAETFAAVKYGNQFSKTSSSVKRMNIYLETVIKPAKQGYVWQTDLPQAERSTYYTRATKVAVNIGLPEKFV